MPDPDKPGKQDSVPPREGGKGALRLSVRRTEGLGSWPVPASQRSIPFQAGEAPPLTSPRRPGPQPHPPPILRERPSHSAVSPWPTPRPPRSFSLLQETRNLDSGFHILFWLSYLRVSQPLLKAKPPGPIPEDSRWDQAHVGWCFCMFQRDCCATL